MRPPTRRERQGRAERYREATRSQQLGALTAVAVLVVYVFWTVLR
jgi:hypothetical protein